MSRLKASDLRAVLFSSAVVLTEGEHDAELVTSWAEQLGEKDNRLGLGGNNFLALPVFGDANFAPVLELLQQSKIPHAVLADGPALAGNSKLAKRFRHTAAGTINAATDFDEAKRI